MASRPLTGALCLWKATSRGGDQLDERLTVLGVWAHPDDESFGPAGTFRKLADEGVRTALVIATRGEMGGISDPSIASPDTLPQVREAELREAARILGVSDIEFLDYQDQQLATADVAQLRGEIVRAIRRLRPQVVLTFGPAGIYGHPDHVAISRVTTEAFTAAGNPSTHTDGLAPYSPRKLYYLALPEALAAEMPSQTNLIPDPDHEITAVVDVREYVDVKLRAVRAHRSQSDFPPEMLDRAHELLAEECYKRVLPHPEPDEPRETDLFAGLR